MKKNKKLDYDPNCIKEYRMYERRGMSPKNPNIRGGIRDITDVIGGQYFKDDQGNEYLNNYKLPLSSFYKKIDKMPLRDYWPDVCPPKINEEKLRKIGALKLDDWIEKVEKYSLTIRDLLKMKPHQKMKMLSIHRNFGDHIDHLKRGKAYNPKFAFRNNASIFIKQEIGKLNEFRGVLIFDKPMNKVKKSNTKEDESFELDIEYKDGQWYPLENGYLPAHGDEGRTKLLGKKIHWSEFSKNTRIGWRGPFVPWSILNKMPKVYTNYPPFDNFDLEIVQKRIKNSIVQK